MKTSLTASTLAGVILACVPAAAAGAGKPVALGQILLWPDGAPGAKRETR